jgi:hypothetical protein
MNESCFGNLRRIRGHPLSVFPVHNTKIAPAASGAFDFDDNNDNNTSIDEGNNTTVNGDNMNNDMNDTCEEIEIEERKQYNFYMKKWVLRTPTSETHQFEAPPPPREHATYGSNMEKHSHIQQMNKEVLVPSNVSNLIENIDEHIDVDDYDIYNPIQRLLRPGEVSTVLPSVFGQLDSCILTDQEKIQCKELINDLGTEIKEDLFEHGIRQTIDVHKLERHQDLCQKIVYRDKLYLDLRNGFKLHDSMCWCPVTPYGGKYRTLSLGGRSGLNIQAHRFMALYNVWFLEGNRAKAPQIDYTSNGYTASHLCGNAHCSNPHCLIMETNAANNDRQRCQGQVNIMGESRIRNACPHNPRCTIESVGKLDEKPSVNQIRRLHAKQYSDSIATRMNSVNRQKEFFKDSKLFDI